MTLTRKKNSEKISNTLLYLLEQVYKKKNNLSQYQRMTDHTIELIKPDTL
jgi:hypothetical protein